MTLGRMTWARSSAVALGVTFGRTTKIESATNERN
jgi:hypothetical protein